MKPLAMLSGLILLSACVAPAAPVPAAFDAPVELGQWHSNMAAAKAKAQLEGVPLLVLWGDPGCAYCKDFDLTLDLPEFQTYLADRKLVMVYEKSKFTPATAVKLWAGNGDWPTVRLTWWKSGTLLSDSTRYPDSRAAVDYRWTRPNNKLTGDGNRTVVFAKFKSVVEGKISSYSGDTSKDKYDPANDAAGGATVLAWSDQAKTEALKLARRDADVSNPAYTDLNDWFQLAVEAGKTYRVAVINVSGVDADAPQIAIYSDAGTTVVNAPVALADGDFEFVPAAAGSAFVKIWRPTGTDTNIQYTLKYMRYAPGQAEFVSTSVAVMESAASAVLTLRRVGGTSGIAKVNVGFADQSATAGQDYNGTARVVTWADGDGANKTLTVPLIKTAIQWEGDETFGVTLDADAGVSPDLTVGGPATVTLKEADPLPAASAPSPASGNSVLARNATVFTWDDVFSVAGDLTGKRFYRVYAGATATSLQLVGTDLTEAEIDMAGNTAFQALVTQANTKPVYWRVDTVYKGVTTGVTLGPVWSVSVMPDGSPEFLESTFAAGGMYVSVPVNEGPLVFTNGLGGTPVVGVAANGGSLPSGLRLEIRNGNQVWLAGTPTRTAAGSLLVQISTKVGTLTRPGTTARINYQIVALPTFAAGTYNGWAGSLEATGIVGTVSLTVSSAGRISGKAVFPTGAPGYAGSYSFAATSYQAVSNGNAWIAGSLTRTRAASVPVWFSVSVADGQVTGGLGAPDAQTPVTLFRSNWSVPGMSAIAAQYAGYYTAAFPVLSAEPEGAPQGSGYATFTLDTRGGFRVAGKLADGTSLSQSGTLFIEQDGGGNPYLCALLYSAPSAYKGGLFAGVVCFGDLNTNGVKDIGIFEGAPLRWTSRDPSDVPVYDAAHPGFEAVLGVSGGWYNKLENLKAFYTGKSLFVGDLAEPPAIGYTLRAKAADGSTATSQQTADPTSWQAVPNLLITPKADGSGFTLPAVNPNGVRLTFSRATGLMSGAFSAFYDYVTATDSTVIPMRQTTTHTTKSCSFAGILLPERIDSGNNIEADGYYLFSSTATAPGATRPYTFNYSFGFTLGSVLVP